MKKYIIKIDRDSVRENTHRDGYTTFVPGRTHHYSDGSITREVVQVSTMGGGPKYWYDRLPCYVTCEHCTETFSWEELIQTDQDYCCELCSSMEDEEDKNICPSCGLEVCCELFLENLSEVELDKIWNANKPEWVESSPGGSHPKPCTGLDDLEANSRPEYETTPGIIQKGLTVAKRLLTLFRGNK